MDWQIHLRMNASFRTKKDKKLELTTSEKVTASKCKIAVKVVDIFGNDTTKVIEITSMEKDSKIKFNQYFKVKKCNLDKAGFFNISLVSDLPLFIDPFHLFYSKKKDYQNLHDNIIKYLVFLREISLLLPGQGVACEHTQYILSISRSKTELARFLICRE